MPSMREQVMARVTAALLNSTPAGANVFRSREVSINRKITPAVVIMAAGTDVTRQATMVDKKSFDFRVEIFVRDDPWDSACDPIDVAAHLILMTDPALWALVTDVRRTNEVFESQEADSTAGTLTVTYRATWLSSARDISKPA